MSSSTLHIDLPTLDDKVGWKPDVERLRIRIQSCPTPHVMGIHGDWGSGKTSFMRQLQSQLGGDIPEDGTVFRLSDGLSKDEKNKLQKKVITIWFDAWRYQNEPVPVVALLHEMQRQMGLISSIKTKFKKLGEITLRYTLNSLTDIGKAIGVEGLPSTDKIEKLGEKWEKEHYVETLQSDAIRNHLQQTIQCLLPEKNARVVIFIDDLDRCNPKAAVRLLEGLKIYLSIPSCAFVLGMNERILVDVIGEEISGRKEISQDELRLRASHYLEKICTDIFRLPLPDKPAEILGCWLANAAHKDALLAAVDTTACLPTNPRRIKALANQWERFANCVDFPSQSDDRKYWAVRVLVAAYIHQFYRDLWERWHFNPEFWNEIKDWCTGKIDGKIIDVDGTNKNPEWAGNLRLLNSIVTWNDMGQPIMKPRFLNPGDIENFWISSLIQKHADHLMPIDFMPLLRCKFPVDGAPT